MRRGEHASRQTQSSSVVLYIKEACSFVASAALFRCYGFAGLARQRHNLQCNMLATLMLLSPESTRPRAPTLAPPPRAAAATTTGILSAALLQTGRFQSRTCTRPSPLSYLDACRLSHPLLSYYFYTVSPTRIPVTTRAGASRRRICTARN